MLLEIQRFFDFFISDFFIWIYHNNLFLQSGAIEFPLPPNQGPDTIEKIDLSRIYFIRRCPPTACASSTLKIPCEFWSGFFTTI